MLKARAFHFMILSDALSIRRGYHTVYLIFAKVRLKPALLIARDAISAEQNSCRAAVADRPPSSIELLRLAAEIDRQAASLL
jgi:hypothetical protein